MSTDAVSPLRQRMIEDMNARKLCAGTQRGHISSCKRFAAFVKRSPDTATLESGVEISPHLCHPLLCAGVQTVDGCSALPVADQNARRPRQRTLKRPALRTRRDCPALRLR